MNRYQDYLELDLLASRARILQMFLDLEFAKYYDTPDTDLDYALWVKEEILKEINSINSRCLGNPNLVQKF